MECAIHTTLPHLAVLNTKWLLEVNTTKFLTPVTNASTGCPNAIDHTGLVRLSYILKNLNTTLVLILRMEIFFILFGVGLFGCFFKVLRQI